MVDDTFTKAMQLKDAKRDQRCKDALLWAKSEAETDAQKKFVKSCQEQYRLKGFLSDKQVEILFKIDSFDRKSEFTSGKVWPVANKDINDYDKYD